MAEQILIVEDSETQAMQLTWLLEEAGWGVIRASTGEAALDELNRNLPALIIVDYHLPGIFGDELCRKVRMNVETRGIPILMLTGDESFGSEPAGLDSGADGYVSKSVAPEILVLRVRALLRGGGDRASVLSPQETHFHRARILAIDDSATWLESLEMAFSSEGYEVAKASCAEEGLARITRESFDCVLVDLIMPGIDGIETCRCINEMARSMEQPIVVIMLTSSETKEDMTRGLEAGADDFVGKSGDMTVLKARIRALLRRKFFQEENRRIREQLMRMELEASEARAAGELAATRAVLAGVREASEHKSRFMANMSHELRTPLNSIIGFTEILYDKRAGEVNEIQEEFLGDSLRSARHLLALINDMLDLEKIARGHKELTLERFDVHQLVRETIHEVSVTAAANQVRLASELDDRLGRVFLDRQKTKQVLLNLAMNAVKFTPDGGLVTVRARVAGTDRWILEVNDTGIGISEHDQTRLFREFEQLESSASKRVQGTGLGLALARSLVEAQGGTMAVASRAAVGSTFSAMLPISLQSWKPGARGLAGSHDETGPIIEGAGVDPAGNVAVSEPLKRTARQREYILILDDDPNVHKLINLALRDSGFQLVHCSDGEAGLREIALRLPSAVVVDLLLPNLDGYNFIARLRQIPNTGAIPVVVWTNLDLSRQETDGLLRDVRQVIYKRDGGVSRLIQELAKELRGPSMAMIDNDCSTARGGSAVFQDRRWPAEGASSPEHLLEGA
jgi:DNA-binding response OmpR family regulator